MRTKAARGAVLVGLLLAAGLSVWALSGQPEKKAPQGGKTPPVEAPWDPPAHVDPDEFLKRYAKYFEPAFLAQQGERIDKNLNPDTLHPSTIRGPDGALGTLFIDATGKVVLAIKQPLVSIFSDGLALVATTTDPKSGALTNYGYVDRTGKLAIPADYEQGQDFREGLAAVRKDGRFGYIDRQGKVVIPFRYQQARDFHDGVAYVQPDRDKVQLIDAKGKVLIEGNQWDVGRFSEGLLYVNLPGEPGKDNGRARGYVDRDLKFVVRLGPDSSGFWPARCEEFHEGRAAVEIGSNQWGFIDREGKLVVPATFAGVQPFSEGLAAVSLRRGPLGQAGYVDRSGKMAIEPRFLSAGSFHDGLASVSISVEDGQKDAGPQVARPVRAKTGYIDRQGRVVIPPRFYQAGPFAHGLARVSENPFHHGYIDKTGAYVWQVTEPTYGFGGKKAERDKEGVAADAVLAKAKIALELRAEQPALKLGDTPRFRAELINQGKEAALIVLPGDGSAWGWRTPIVRWQPPMRVGPRCGNINALKASEVVTLRPGQRVDVSEWLHGPTLDKAGEHKVVLEIENVPDLTWKGEPLGKHDAAAMEQVRRSAAFKATSNAVTVQVE